MEYWTLALAGLIISLFSSLVGIGGGLLWAPFFIFFAGFDFNTAIVFSFTVQVVGMGSATYYHFCRKSIQWKISYTLLPIIALGVVIGGLIGRLISNQHILEASLGIISLVEAVFFTAQIEDYDEVLIVDSAMAPPQWLKWESTLFGAFSGLFSIGVSDFIIPMLRGKLKLPMSNAIGTSIFLNFCTALTGMIFAFAFQNYTLPSNSFTILLYCWGGVIVGGQIGPRLGQYFDDNRLKELFIFVLLILGIHLIYRSL